MVFMVFHVYLCNFRLFFRVCCCFPFFFLVIFRSSFLGHFFWSFFGHFLVIFWSFFGHSSSISANFCTFAIQFTSLFFRVYNFPFSSLIRSFLVIFGLLGVFFFVIISSFWLISSFLLHSRSFFVHSP
jgi:hypothetical protein